MNNIKLFSLTLFILCSYSVSAQYYEPNKKSDDKNKHEIPQGEKSFIDKIHFGGNLGLQFGSYTSVYISPIAYYDVSDDFMVGLGFNYIYQKYKYSGENITTSIYGPRVAAMYRPFKSLMLSTEYEYNYFDYEIAPKWYGSWFVGIGYSIPMGKKGGMYVSMSYDLLYDSYYTYNSSPWRPTVGVYF